jgi:hypothetical protein
MDINKEFEKLAEEFEKEWHDGHEPQGIDDQYVEEMEDGEEIELDEVLKSKDKSVIDAFYDKDSLVGRILSTNGRSLEKHGMGGQTIAAWLKDKIAITAVSDVKSTESILKYMKNTIPKLVFDPKSWKKFFEDVEEASTYRDKARDDEKKKKRHFAFGGKKDKTRHGAGGYGKGSEEVEEKKSHTGYELYHKDFSSAIQHAIAHAKKKGFVVDPKEIDDKVATGPKKPSSGKTNRYALKAGRKTVQIQIANLDNKRYELNMYIEGLELIPEGFKDLPPHLQKSLKEFEKKQKALKKQFPELKTKTFVYNPETGKPDIEVKEDYDKNQLLRVKHDEALIAEAGDICALNRGVLRSKSMQAIWEKKCAPKLNNQTLGEDKMEKLVDTVRRVLMGEAESGDKEAYQKFFNNALKKFKIKSPADLKDDEAKKKFYDYIDKNWKGEHEQKEDVGELSDKELKSKMKGASSQKETDAACGEMGKRRLKMEKKKVVEKTISKLFSHVRKLMSK